MASSSTDADESRTAAAMSAAVSTNTPKGASASTQDVPPSLFDTDATPGAVAAAAYTAHTPGNSMRHISLPTPHDGGRHPAALDNE